MSSELGYGVVDFLVSELCTMSESFASVISYCTDSVKAFILGTLSSLLSAMTTTFGDAEEF
jgi:hypothetical protein